MNKPGSKTKTKSRPASIPSCESPKSNEPKEAIIDSKRRKLDKSGSQTRPGPSCESLKSDRSKDPILDFKRRTMVKPGSETKRKSSSGPDPGPSCESLKSDRSKLWPINFKRDSNPHPALSCGSSLSDSSKDWDEEFKNSPPENMGAESSTDQLGIDPLLPVFTRLQEKVLGFAKEQVQSFHRALNSDYPECSERVAEEQRIREALLTIALHFLERMGEGRVAERLFSQSAAGVCRDQLQQLVSSSALKHLDLSHCFLTDSQVEKLCSGLKSATCRLEVLSLSFCRLSHLCCESLASVLGSSALKHLDLSNNDLTDSGVEQLCSGLKSATCRLEVLRLSGCVVSERGGAALASALSSAHSHLTELDLSYNHPGASAEVLTAVRDHPHYPLHTLRLDPAGERWMVTGPRKYFCDVSLDPNTANNTLQLSEDRRTVTRVEALQLYPSHQDRFSSCPQLLSSTALTGRSYFEVEWSGDVVIALSHRGIGRRGDLDQCRFGDNDQSWSLRIEGDEMSFYHCKSKTQLDKNYYSPQRVGVFLDSEAGVLSFSKAYDYNKYWYRLHSVSVSVSEPLFVGFSLERPGSSVSLLNSDDLRKL
uniref:B30.2/SPRY domain-containing protein n=1 Tax=Knipowitschia caucasica TaxID=637954 RepID=A0AAV2ML54_KNICA